MEKTIVQINQMSLPVVSFYGLESIFYGDY